MGFEFRRGMMRLEMMDDFRGDVEVEEKRLR